MLQIINSSIRMKAWTRGNPVQSWRWGSHQHRGSLKNPGSWDARNDFIEVFGEVPWTSKPISRWIVRVGRRSKPSKYWKKKQHEKIPGKVATIWSCWSICWRFLGTVWCIRWIKIVFCRDCSGLSWFVPIIRTYYRSLKTLASSA